MKQFDLISATLFLLMSFFLFACADDDSDSKDESLALHYSQALQMVLDETLAQYHGPGAVLGVRFADGSEWIGIAGEAKLSDDQPEAMTVDHHFRMGSVTKTFTGTATLLLVQNGSLSLDDPLADWLPGLVPDSEAITVRMLLNHTSGLYDFTWSEDYLEPYLDELIASWTPEQLVAIAVEEGPIFAPGEGAVYCNTNFMLLGLIIEAASGQSAEAFIESNVLEPLGLRETYFPTDIAMPQPYTHGYLDWNADGMFSVEDDVTLQNPSAIWTAGAMVSTAGDLLDWLDELLDSELIDSALQAERLAFDVQIDDFPDGRFGLAIVELDGGIGHTGAVPGYQSIIMRYEETDFVVNCNGYQLNEDALNIANQIYSAALEVVYPGSDTQI